MNGSFNCFVAAAALLSMSTIARADDFGGLYVGGLVGWNKTSMDTTLGGGYSTSTSRDMDGFAGGIYAGYNLRSTGPFIYGIEGDFSLGKSDDTMTYVDTDGNEVTRIEFNTDLSSVANLRARLGMQISDNMMVYAAAGLAIARIKSDASFDWTDGTDSLALSSASQTKTLTGYSVGVGTEAMLDGHWALRAEYLYSDFGDARAPATFKSNLGTAVIGNDLDLTSHTIRAGLAYKF